jgi:hypothetical protein
MFPSFKTFKGSGDESEATLQLEECPHYPSL